MALAAKLACDIAYHQRTNACNYRNRATWVRKPNGFLRKCEMLSLIELKSPKPPTFLEWWAFTERANDNVYSLDIRDWCEHRQRSASSKQFSLLKWGKVEGNR